MVVWLFFKVKQSQLLDWQVERRIPGDGGRYIKFSESLLEVGHILRCAFLFVSMTDVTWFRGMAFICGVWFWTGNLCESWAPPC